MTRPGSKPILFILCLFGAHCRAVDEPTDSDTDSAECKASYDVAFPFAD